MLISHRINAKLSIMKLILILIIITSIDIADTNTIDIIINIRKHVERRSSLNLNILSSQRNLVLGLSLLADY